MTTNYLFSCLPTFWVDIFYPQTLLFCCFHVYRHSESIFSILKLFAWRVNSVYRHSEQIFLILKLFVWKVNRVWMKKLKDSIFQSSCNIRISRPKSYHYHQPSLINTSLDYQAMNGQPSHHLPDLIKQDIALSHDSHHCVQMNLSIKHEFL